VPPVLPVVLYNGDARWNAPTDSTDLVSLSPDSPLWHWQPRVRYHLVDEGAFPGSELARRDTLVALLFRLETCQNPADLTALVGEVIGWFRQHPGYEELKRLFHEIMQQAISGLGTRGEAVVIPDEMLEARNMLATRVQEWVRQWKAEGTAEGIDIGEVSGRTKMLTRQLCRRFGELPADAVEQINSATAEQLDEWMDRLMDAKSLDDVFQDGQMN